MTDLDRLRDAVVQALKGVMQAPLPPGKHTTSGGVVFVPLVEWANVENALAALDAYPTRATAETVRVAVWTNGNHYSFTHPQLRQGNEYTRLGTTTLRLDTEAKG